MTYERVVEILCDAKNKTDDEELAQALGKASDFISSKLTPRVEECSFFDIEEIHKNCTVQIWANSVTGDVSVGWWRNR